MKPKILLFRKKQFHSGYICSDCALEKGAEWPSGHCATVHRGICHYCFRVRGLANIGDWNWSDGNMRGMRD